MAARRFSLSLSLRSKQTQLATAQAFWAMADSPQVAWIEYRVRQLHAEITGGPMPPMPVASAPYACDGMPTGLSGYDRTMIARQMEAYQLKNPAASRTMLLEEEKRLTKMCQPGLIPMAFIKGEGKTNANSIPSGLVMIDVDHFDGDMEAAVSMLKSRATELGIVYIGISISGDGIRVLFISPEGMDIVKAQEWFSRETGMNNDEAIKNPSRFSFAVTRADILFIDEHRMFEREDETATGHIHTMNHTPVQEPLAKDEPDAIPADSSQLLAQLLAIPFDPDLEYKGLKCADLWQRYFDTIRGGTPTEGYRHEWIGKGIMHLAPEFDSDPRILMACTPRLGKGDAEIASLIIDKLRWIRKDPSFAGRTQKVARMADQLRIETADRWLTSPCPSIEDSRLAWLSVPQQAKWVDELLSILDDAYKLPAKIAMKAAEMAMLDQVRCQLAGFPATELAASSFVVGYPGTGKGWILQPIKELTRPLKEASQREEQREAEYEQKVKKAESDKKGKMPEKKYFAIRWIPSETTRNRHVEILAAGRCTFTLDPELRSLLDSMSKAAYDRKSFLLKCFDRDEVGGQTCLSKIPTAPCRFNYVVCSPFDTLKAAFPDRSLLTGELFRATFVVAPNTVGRMSQLSLRSYTDTQRKLIHRVGEMMMRCTGLAHTPRLSKAISEWHRRTEAELYAKRDFEALLILSRIPLICFRIGVVEHIEWGLQRLLAKEKRTGQEPTDGEIDVSQFRERNETIEFALSTADYLLSLMCSLFRKRIKARHEAEAGDVEASSKAHDFLAELPEGEFTYESLMAATWTDATLDTIRMRINKLIRKGQVRRTRTEKRVQHFEKCASPAKA